MKRWCIAFHLGDECVMFGGGLKPDAWLLTCTYPSYNEAEIVAEKHGIGGYIYTLVEIDLGDYIEM